MQNKDFLQIRKEGAEKNVFGGSMEKNNLLAEKHETSVSNAASERRKAECPIYTLDGRDTECPIYPLDGKKAESPIFMLGPPDSESSTNIQIETCGKDKKEAPKGFGEAPVSIIKAGSRHPPANLSEGRANHSPLSNHSNYHVFPVRKRVFKDRFGREHKEKEEIVCKIKIENSEPEEFSILTQDIKRLTVIVGDKFSSACVNPDMAHAAKTIENAFRSETQRIPVSKIYIDHGWQTINGRRVYAHDGHYFSETIIFQTGMTLPSYHSSWAQAGQVFFDAYGLYAEKGPMSVMLAFSMLGVLYRVFDEAGYKPRFVLFIHGKTGSMKTTLSKILFIQLTNEIFRDAPRRINTDTVTSFERGIILNGRDTVTLVDDYAPAKSPRQQADNDEKLESIIRMVGDGTGKNRSNPDLEDCRSEGVKGVVALTGELTGKGLSSNLRCFYCGIQKEYVNESMVTYFQDMPYSFTTLIQYFAFYVAENWDKIMEYIKGSFQQERASARQVLTERRLVDSAAVLRITCNIIRGFLVRCGRNPDKANMLTEEMRNEILMMAVVSENISLEETTAIRFVKIVEQLLHSGKLNMLAEKPNEQNLTSIDGFYDDQFYYFLPENLYEKVKKVFFSSNIYLPLNLDEAVKALAEESIIKPSPNGYGKKTYYARIPMGDNKKRSFIKIHKEILQRIAEN